VLGRTVATIGFFEYDGYTMTLPSEKIGEILVVSPVGQINSANAADIESGLLAWVEKGERQCVLDLGQLDYISSAGLRVVLMLAKRLKQSSGQLVLCSLQPQVHEVFDISGFLSILTVVDSRPAALSQLEA
jgi:stage II sporulation protein AA (anti-sigma F factor antagonist)